MPRGKINFEMRAVGACCLKSKQCSGKLFYFKSSFGKGKDGRTLCNLHFKECAEVDGMLIKHSNPQSINFNRSTLQ